MATTPGTQRLETMMAKKTKAKKSVTKRVPWTAALRKELKQYSKDLHPVDYIATKMKRTAGSLRQQANKMGISIGHQRRKKTTARKKRL